MQRVLKRGIDVAVATVGLILLLPLLLTMAIAIRIALGGPVFFRQIRPGLKATPFTLLKFRTMTETRDAHGVLFPEAQRLTRVGKFLRRFSFDEIPQLWNVLRGDMSLVGPRPLLMQYLGRYTPQQARRHDVKPGMTGWAQINGRNATTWEDRLRNDVWYVDNWSLALDLKVLAKTALATLSGKGLTPEREVVMPEFMGTGVASQIGTAEAKKAGADSL
jgi:sugar transferase EpsL